MAALLFPGNALWGRMAKSEMVKSKCGDDILLYLAAKHDKISSYGSVHPDYRSDAPVFLFCYYQIYNWL